MSDATLPNDGVFKYKGKGKDYTFSPDDINSFNLFVLTQAGITHKMGNECSSRVTAWSKSEEGKDATEEDKALKYAEFQDEMAAKITGEEKLGVRAAGAPRVTGMEARRRAAALVLLRSELDKQAKRTGQKVAVPTGEDTITIGTKTYNREQLIEASLRKFATQIDEIIAKQDEVDTGGLFDAE